jgi:predicted nucleic acid-binding protein
LIVFDASAAVEMVLRTRAGELIKERALDSAESLHAPHLIDIEVASVLRRLLHAEKIDAERAEQALEDFEALTIERYDHISLLWRIWSLRSALTPYDASYVALAEGLRAPVLTCDGKLSRAHGHTAQIEYIPLDPDATAGGPQPAG